MRPDGPRFGPSGPARPHLRIDMRVLSADRTAWHTPWIERLPPPLATLVPPAAVPATRA